MDRLGKHIGTFLKNKKNPTSERAHLIQQICDTLFDDSHFTKILGQTRQCTVSEIRDMFTEAKNWEKNPRALFWKLVREKREDIRKQLAGKSKRKKPDPTPPDVPRDAQ